MPDQSPTQRWRKPLLITEFSALAVLLASMGWFSSRVGDGEPLSPAWLLIPALASLAVFISFIGLMYMRWVVAAAAERRVLHKVVFALLVLTILGVWAFGIANTWTSLSAA
jgi:H+/Cl- antiporter ClcA